MGSSTERNAASPTAHFAGQDARTTDPTWLMLDADGPHDMTAEMAHQAAGAPTDLAYAGIAFSVEATGDLPALPPAYAPYVLSLDAVPPVPTVARVTCRVVLDATLPAQQLNRALYVGRAGGFRMQSDYAEAEVLLDTATRTATATARIAPEAMGWAALLRFVSVGLIERLGGVSLHAAGVVFDDRAVLLLGPSGAGKSTACDLCPEALTFAYDQVVVYPDPVYPEPDAGDAGTGYCAWALPWGQGSRTPRTERPTLPLAACLRVTRGTPVPEARPASAIEGLFELRQATTVNERTREAEERRLGTLSAIAERVPTGYLSTVLGVRADVAINGFLAARTRATGVDAVAPQHRELRP